MRMMKRFLPAVILLVILVGCSWLPVKTENLQPITNTPTASRTPGNTAVLIHTALPIYTPTLTHEPTLKLPTNKPTPTLPSLIVTEEALSHLCNEFNLGSHIKPSISPYGNWLAVSCGYDSNQALIVQDQEGTRWIIKFENYDNPDWAGKLSSFKPLVWSSDRKFLYFTRVFEGSGGGSQCFTGGIGHGLYRLHLRTGTVITMFPMDDTFIGYKIMFSPNTEYYAIDKNGIRITDAVSGEVTLINTSGVMEMIWSPDSRYLAYSVATCGEVLVEASSAFVWDSVKDEIKLLYSVEDMLLRPVIWMDASTLRFEGEVWVGFNNVYTIFEYDVAEDGLIFSGTATPHP